ncbi:hypothetical protein DYB34_006348, partial [Aphanomyces astaci]
MQYGGLPNQHEQHADVDFGFDNARNHTSAYAKKVDLNVPILAITAVGVIFLLFTSSFR